MHFEYEKFSLVKLLLQNRLRIVWCTRFARARSEEEREQIKEEMLGSDVPELGEILLQVNATRATTRERESNLERSIKEMAQRSKNECDNQKVTDMLNGLFYRTITFSSVLLQGLVKQMWHCSLYSAILGYI